MDEQRRQEFIERRDEPARVLALSDGVFAIVLTLLVLEIHVPDLARGQSLREALQEIWPSFVAFVISFVVVAVAWAGHRDLFSLIRRTDRTLVWLNMLYMLPVSMLPFGAALLARYSADPAALTLYGLLVVAIALTRLLIWGYATGRRQLLFAPLDAGSRRSGFLIAAAPGIAAAAGVVVATIAPVASLAIFAAGPIIYFVAITLVRRIAPRGAAERDFT